jgi:hypothetical protein
LDLTNVILIPLNCFVSATRHRLSLSSKPIYGNPEEKKEKNLVHLHFGLALPSYIIKSSVFYLAHTDLSISNLLVDPSDGTLLGIIDWEFANTLPPQAVEHYPSFLGNRAEFVKHYERFFDDPTAELEDWRAHYNKQFIDEPTISVFNDRIDLISNFEHLLRYPNERTLRKIADALEALQSVNALSEPLPDLPWLSHLRQKPPPVPTNACSLCGSLLPRMGLLLVSSDADCEGDSTPV